MTDDGAVRLPRRVGFFVRWRARLGLLPGQVSTAALVQARRYRWSLWIGLPFLALVLVIVPVTIATSSSSSTDVPVTVIAASPPHPHSGDSFFSVEFNDERVLRFDHDPGVRVGDPVMVRQRGFDAPQGFVRNGVYVASTSATNDDGVGVALLVLVFYGLPIGVFLIPSGVWGRRVYKQMREDLHLPMATVTGRYVGSWTWRGISSRLWRRQHTLANLSGFPVAIEESPGQFSWFGAPVNLLTEVRHFETISRGTRALRSPLGNRHRDCHALVLPGRCRSMFDRIACRRSPNHER